MDFTDGLGLISFITIIACTILYNIVIYRQKKHIAELEDENCGVRAENEALRRDRDDLYERYMASLAREARRDG